MNRPTLRDAMDALNARKTVNHRDDREVVDLDTHRRLYVGMDIDVEDLIDEGDRAAFTFLKGGIEHDLPAVMVIRSAWMDGVATGMLLAELRDRAEVRSRT